MSLSCHDVEDTTGCGITGAPLLNNCWVEVDSHCWLRSHQQMQSYISFQSITYLLHMQHCFLTISPLPSHCFGYCWRKPENHRQSLRQRSNCFVLWVLYIHTLAGRNCKLFFLNLICSLFSSKPGSRDEKSWSNPQNYLLKSKRQLGLLPRNIHHPALFCWDLCWMTSSAG